MTQALLFICFFVMASIIIILTQADDIIEKPSETIILGWLLVILLCVVCLYIGGRI